MGYPTAASAVMPSVSHNPSMYSVAPIEQPIIPQTFGQPGAAPFVPRTQTFEPSMSMYGGTSYAAGQPNLASSAFYGQNSFVQPGQASMIPPGLAQTSLLSPSGAYGQGYSTATMGNYSYALGAQQTGIDC
jgi:hypothetical protein